MAAGQDMLEVARAYEELAEVAGELAKAVKAEDGAVGPRARARRSAEPKRLLAVAASVESRREPRDQPHECSLSERD